MRVSETKIILIGQGGYNEKKYTLLICLTSLLFIVSCGGGGGSDGNDGSSPTISQLSYSPTSVYTDSGEEPKTINGTFNFSDPDGDLSTVTIMVLDSSNQTILSETSNVTGVSGIKSGVIEGSVTAVLPIVGEYTIQVFVTDGKENQSNLLAGILRILEFPYVIGTPMPTTRGLFASASINGFIYIIGGNDPTAGTIPRPPVDTMEIYNPSNDTWETGPSLPIACYGLIAGVVNGKIYVFGGKNENHMQVSVVQEYNPTTQEWAIKTDMPDDRYLGAVAVLDDLIYIAGGDSGGFGLSSLLYYDPASDAFHYGASMNQSRRGPGAVAVDDKILVYGGYGNLIIADGGYLGSVENYDPFTDDWSVMTSGVPRRDFGAVGFDGLMYTFGGNNVARSLDIVEAYDSWSDTWSYKTSMPVGIDFVRAEVVNDKIYVFGESDTIEYTPSNDIL